MIITSTDSATVDRIVQRDKEGISGYICDMRGMAMVEGQANAKLIAAAPELLEACINSLKTFYEIGCTQEAEIVQHLESAIKKATE